MPPNPRQRFAVVVPAGPGPQEFERVADVLDSLHAFEPGVASVIIVDDGGPDGADLSGAAGPLADRTVVIPNPRDPDADGWSEGVLVGIATGLAEVLRVAPDVDWILRLDTDALITGPFADAIGTRFASDPLIGMVGTYEHDIDGTRRDFTVTGRPVRRLRAPISLWRRQRRIRTSLFGVGRERRKVLDEAIHHGYEPGVHCQGGAYAISMTAVRSVAERGWLDCRLWRGTYLSEDVVMAIQLAALGLLLQGMVAPGEPFAVQHLGLPGEPLDLLAAGYSIVHSVKTCDGHTEQELRDLFRAHRRGERTITLRPADPEGEGPGFQESRRTS